MKRCSAFRGGLENDVMTALAQVILRTTGARIDIESLSAELIFGGILLVVALFGTATYGLDLSWGFF
jgi:hypothetical protein